MSDETCSQSDSTQPQPKIAGSKPIVEEVEAGEYSYCSCGESQNQPFCDGSHKGTCFKPMKYKVEEKKRVAWCTCKRSAKMPLCDGAHKNLEECNKSC